MKGEHDQYPSKSRFLLLKSRLMIKIPEYAPKFNTLVRVHYIRQKKIFAKKKLVAVLDSPALGKFIDFFHIENNSIGTQRDQGIYFWGNSRRFEIKTSKSGLKKNYHFGHREIISDTKAWSSAERIKCFYFFFVRIGFVKPLRLKRVRIVPIFYISMQPVIEYNYDTAFWKSEVSKCIVVKSHPVADPCRRIESHALFDYCVQFFASHAFNNG